MTTFTEGMHPLEFMVSEASGTRSRETGTLISGQDLDAGSVVGIITASGKLTASVAAAVDGSEDAVGILAYPCDASAADASCVYIARDAEVNGGEITWEDSIDPGDLAAGIASLGTKGIIVR